MTDDALARLENKVRTVLANARWWRNAWKAGQLNEVQPAVVLDDVLYRLEHDD